MITTRTKLIVCGIAITLIVGVIWTVQDKGESVYNLWASTD